MVSYLKFVYKAGYLKHYYSPHLIGTPTYDDRSDPPRYGTIINNLSGLYMYLGQYDKAVPLLLEALKITESTIGKN